MDLVDRACALHQQALDRLDAGDPRRARDLFTRAHKIFTDLGPASRGDLANVLVERSVAHRVLGELAAARADLERSLQILKGARGRDVDRLRARAGADLTVVLIDSGDYATALRVARAAAKVADKLPAADRAPVFNALGMACKYTAKFSEGLAAYRRAGVAARHAYPAGSLFHATLEHNLGGIHHTAGDARKAEPHARRSVALRAAHLGPDHPDTLADEAALAAVLDLAGRWDEADELHRRVIAGFTAALGPRHPEVAHSTGNYAAHLQLCGRTSEAARLHRKAILLKWRALGDLHPATSQERCNLAELELARGRPDRAAVLFERALAGYRENLGPTHPDTRECRARLAAALRAA